MVDFFFLKKELIVILICILSYFHHYWLSLHVNSEVRFVDILTPPPHILSLHGRLRMAILLSDVCPRENDSIVQRTRCSLVWPRVTLISRPCGVCWNVNVCFALCFEFLLWKNFSNSYLLKGNKVGGVVSRPRARVYLVAGLHLACGVLWGEWVPEGLPQISLLGAVKNKSQRKGQAFHD